MSIANITTALTQLLIGFIVGKSKNIFDLDEDQIFLIFMVYSGMALMCFLGESRMVTKKTIQKKKDE